MPTLVLPPRHSRDTNAIWHAAVQAGWDIERLQSWRAPESLAGRDLVLYAEPLFVAVVADALGLAMLEPPLGWPAQLCEDLRRREIRGATLAEARTVIEPKFIKPADDKCFTARVYSSGADLPAAGVLPESLHVLIAEPVSWEVEFRCFVLDRAVVTISVYLREGELAESAEGGWPAAPDEEQEARAFAARVLADPRVALPPAVVLDVGRIRGRGWAVVEANAAWGSGLYGCDAERVLPVLRRACMPRGAVTAEDRAWVVERG